MADAATVARLQGKALEMRRRLLRLANRTNLHIGGDLSMTELMTVVFEYLMRVDPERPTWDDRDRFILSKGHGAGALYISMANRGFFDVEEIYATYGALGSRFGMHPCRNHLPGVETSTGSLGHGLSVAVGLALAARLDARTNRVVTLIGDGELNEGSIWEAVMAAAHFRLGNIVAFVDKNDMTMDGATDDIMRVNPVDAKFDAFGWHVVEVDGHDVAALVDVVDSLPPADGDRPTVVVAHTVKGRGIGFMENTTKWHSGQIDDATLEQCYAELESRERSSGMSVVDVTVDGSAGAANAREVYGAALVELARRHPEVVALTADLMLSHQLKGFKETHPERFVNVGIAEANLMGVAAGLALDGKIPFATTFAAFASMRAHEQVRSDIAYPGLPVKIVGTMGGLSGGVAGPTHAGMEDLGTMRMMPGMTVIAPSDPLHLTQFVEQAYARPGPVYIRLGRGNDPIVYPKDQAVEIGKAITVLDGSDATIVSTGVMLRGALLAAGRLADDGIAARVIDMHTVRPLDVEVVQQAARETGVIVTVEDHMVTNGLGSAVAECVAESGAACRVARLGIPDVFSIIGSPAELYHHHGYDASGIETKVRALLGT